MINIVKIFRNYKNSKEKRRQTCFDGEIGSRMIVARRTRDFDLQILEIHLQFGVWRGLEGV